MDDFPPESSPEPRWVENDGFRIARRHSHDGVWFRPDEPNTEYEEGDLYEFVEFHWDVGEGDLEEEGLDTKSGTAKPLELIESVEDSNFGVLTKLPDARRDTAIKHRFDVERLNEEND